VDLSKLSRRDLEAIAAGPAPQQQAAMPDLAKLSPEDLKAIAAGPSDPGLVEQASTKALAAGQTVGSYAKGAAGWIGSAVDRLTGAPVRAGIDEAMAPGAPFEGLAGAARRVASRVGRQYLEPAETAPTGKEIAAKAGFSTEANLLAPFKDVTGANVKASPAGVAGFGIDVAADPTNLIPGRTLAGAGAKVGVVGVGMAAKGTAKAVDAATGMKAASRLVGATGDVKKAASETFQAVFNPKQALDFGEMVAIAQRNGIDPRLLPEAVEFGPDSIVSRVGRARAEGPLGQPHIEKFRAGQESVRKATEAKIGQIAGGPPLTRQDAGSLIRRAYDERVSEFLGQFEDTYSKVGQRHPGLQMPYEIQSRLADTLNDVEAFAQRRLSHGITGEQQSQARSLMNASRALQNANGSYQGTLEVLRNLGDAAYKSKTALSLDPPDVKRLRELYGKVSDALVDTVAATEGPEVAKALRANNQQMSQFFGDKSVLDGIVGNKMLSDERVFDAVITSGDSKKIAALRSILGPEELQRLKGSFLDSLLAPDLNGEWSFPRLESALKSPRGRQVLENLFEPAEVKEIVDLVRLGDRFGDWKLSSSGSSAGLVLSNMKEGTKGAFITDSFLRRAMERARSRPGAIIPDAKIKGSETMSGLADEFGPPTGKAPRKGGPVSSALPEAFRRGPVEWRSKATQVYSTQDTDENNARREAIRRKLQGGR